MVTYSFFIPTRLWIWNRRSVPRSWHKKFRRLEIISEESTQYS